MRYQECRELGSFPYFSARTFVKRINMCDMLMISIPTLFDPDIRRYDLTLH